MWYRAVGVQTALLCSRQGLRPTPTHGSCHQAPWGACRTRLSELDSVLLLHVIFFSSLHNCLISVSVTHKNVRSCVWGRSLLRAAGTSNTNLHGFSTKYKSVHTAVSKKKWDSCYTENKKSKPFGAIKPPLPIEKRTLGCRLREYTISFNSQ